MGSSTDDRAVVAEESIFAQAVEISSVAERAAFLARSCGANQALRGESRACCCPPTVGRSSRLARETCRHHHAPVTERPGTVIGPYKLLEEIGEGVSASSSMAEQTQPVRRKVALKILKPGMDTRQVIARFEAERKPWR